VLSWHLIELVVAKCRRGQPFHPAVTLAVHLVIWGACLTCLIWLAFWIDSYGPYSGTWASYLQVRPKLKVFGSVLTALIGCLLLVTHLLQEARMMEFDNPPGPCTSSFLFAPRPSCTAITIHRGLRLQFLFLHRLRSNPPRQPKTSQLF
jgi:hypothetical protein